MAWVASSGFKQVVVLTGADAGHRVDAQMTGCVMGWRDGVLGRIPWQRGDALDGWCMCEPSAQVRFLGTSAWGRSEAREACEGLGWHSLERPSPEGVRLQPVPCHVVVARARATAGVLCLCRAACASARVCMHT